MKNKNEKSIIWKMFVLVFLIVLTITSCTPATQPTQPAAPVNTLEVAPSEVAPTQVIPTKEPSLAAFGVASSSVGPNSIHLLVGQWLGYYAEEGLKLEYRTLGSTAAVESQLKSGEINFGLAEFATMGQMYKEQGSTNGVMFYEYTYPTKQNFGVPDDSKITSLKDLVGLKVGISMDEDTARLARLWLAADGVSYDDIKWVALGDEYATMGLAWQRGEVDAMFSEDSAWGVMAAMGLKFHFLPKPAGFPAIGGFGIQSTPTFISEHPDQVIGFARATCKGSLFVLENPQAAAWIFMQMFPEATPEGNTLQEQVDTIVKAIQYRAFVRNGYKSWDPAYADTCGWISLQEAQSENTFYGWGFNDAVLGSFFTNQFSKEINNFDKEAIKTQAREFTWPQ